MRFRKLRIAWSAACAIACVLLIVFWVRSFQYAHDIYWGKQSLAFRTIRISRFVSRGGGIWVEFRPSMVSADKTRWLAYPHKGGYVFLVSPKAKLPEQLGFIFSSSDRTWVFPCWFPVLLSATSAMLPWIGRLHWRFSLRTLLIATTLVAVVLSTVVYATRQ